MANSCRERVGGCCGCLTLLLAVGAGVYCYQRPDRKTIILTIIGTTAGLLVCGWLAGPTSRTLGGHRPWRNLRGVDFEHFLADLFRNLGYRVDHVGQTGDQGVDLIVSMAGSRIAIQAKGYDGAVGNAAVQQAFTGMHFHRCQRCAVITNSSFTVAAVALAATLPGCTLVAGDQIDDLIAARLRI